MTRPAKEVIAEAATALERLRPELAAELRALKRPGPKPHEGHTPHNLRLAKIWIEMQMRVDAGEDEGDVLADVSQRERIPYDKLCDVWALEGRPDVRAILNDPKLAASLRDEIEREVNGANAPLTRP